MTEVSRFPSRPPIILALTMLATIATVVILGGLSRDAEASHWVSSDFFHLDKEGGLVAAVSGLILLATALHCFRLSPLKRWMGMGIVFGFMALDEVFAIHEHTEEWTGVFWQVLYLPIILLAVLVWLMCLLVMHNRLGSLLWIAGACFWAFSQSLEYLQWHQLRHLQPQIVLWEEMLEMLGSASWLLATSLLVREKAGGEDQRPQRSDDSNRALRPAPRHRDRFHMGVRQWLTAFLLVLTLLTGAALVFLPVGDELSAVVAWFREAGSGLGLPSFIDLTVWEIILNVVLFAVPTGLATLSWPRVPWWVWLLLAVLCSASIEIIQYIYLPRSAELKDFVANSSGAAVILLLIGTIRHLRRAPSQAVKPRRSIGSAPGPE